MRRLTKFFCFYIVRSLYFFEGLIRRNKPLSPSKVLVFGYVGIGNMILFLPTLRALKTAFPSAKITLITDTTRKCEELIKETPWIDEVKYFDRDKAGFWGNLGMIFACWRAGYDTLFANIHFPGFPWTLAILAIPRRIRAVSRTFHDKNYDFYFTDKVGIDHLQHELDMNHELLRVYGIESGQVDRTPEIAIGEGEMEGAEFLKSHIDLDGKTLIAIAPGVAGQVWKQWPMERMAELGRRLMQDKAVVVVILGSPAEGELNLAFFGPNSAQLVHGAGELSLRGTASLIKKSRLIIGNDSGLLHIAAAVGTPIVMIAGPTNIARSQPVSPLLHIVTKGLECQPCYTTFNDEKASSCPHRNCLEEITVDEVWEIIREITIK